MKVWDTKHFGRDCPTKIGIRMFRSAPTRLRQALTGLTVLVSVMSLSACGSGAPATTSSNGMTNVNFVEAVHNLGYIDLYVAQHQGFFAQQGINLNLSAAGGDSQAFAAILGGSAQFAMGDATLAALSRG